MLNFQTGLWPKSQLSTIHSAVFGSRVVLSALSDSTCTSRVCSLYCPLVQITNYQVVLNFMKGTVNNLCAVLYIVL